MQRPEPALALRRYGGTPEDGVPIPCQLARAHPCRLAEFVAGRLAAQEALRRATGMAAIPGTGRSRAPDWPEGTVGSISHSGGLAVAIAGSSRNWTALGIDLEAVPDEETAAEIAPLVFGAQDRVPPGRFGTGLAFAAKEALFKALNPRVRIFFGFRDAVLTGCDGCAGELRLEKSLGTDWPAGSRIGFRHGMLEGRILARVEIPARLPPPG
ncbi:4'-phosphopantetheinyl transferase [Mangrovicoccus sp. HB161399]|uniref:4'-phosphopantetheinyl transferase family protein n=1 Tax=Mangrovicoccus sp. HB161399 TaxID=2720392 RepID=UPI001553CB3D|nr:4'-phosphopantetheinyl transferase superfamily protein [Mangrovicoccus sp. HB161399]